MLSILYPTKAETFPNRENGKRARNTPAVRGLFDGRSREQSSICHRFCCCPLNSPGRWTTNKKKEKKSLKRGRSRVVPGDRASMANETDRKKS